jgi:hypothetical protein
MVDLDDNRTLESMGIPNPSSQATSRFDDALQDDEMSGIGTRSFGSFSASGMSMDDVTNGHSSKIMNRLVRPDSMPSAVGVDSDSGVSDSTLTPIGVRVPGSAPSWNATAILNEYYFQKHPSNRIIPSFKKYFVSWPTGPLNNLRWTCVFVCPHTGECFSAGTLRNDSSVDGKWYGTKKYAEKAAAGRAMDCFRFREQQQQQHQYGAASASSFLGFCTQEPYDQHPSPRKQMEIPPDVPPQHYKEIQELQNIVTKGALL